MVDKRKHNSGAIGHRKSKSGLLYGKGCPKHPDCFSCPYADCEYPYKEENKGGLMQRRRKLLSE